MEELNIRNSVQEITKEWSNSSQIQYLDDQSLWDMNRDISVDMKKFRSDFYEKEILSQIESSKVVITD